MRKLSHHLLCFMLLSLSLGLSLKAEQLTALGKRPDWQALNAYQLTITREDFVQLLDTLYAPGNAWHEMIVVEEGYALIRTREGESPFRLNFAESESLAAPIPRLWRTPSEALVFGAELPLTGWHIALDPGHLGGDYGPMEGRSWRIGSGPVIQEGDLVLTVAFVLKRKLEALGASVSLVRDAPGPVTTETPESLHDEAKAWLSSRQENLPSEEQIQRTAERLFYRSSEIRARAERVNEHIRPDLVLCLHLNAEDFPDYKDPQPIESNHLHLLVNGAYSAEELAYDDIRYGMLVKLLNGSASVELPVAQQLATTMAEHTQLPPYRYSGPNAIAIADEPYVWGRNLAANRLYECPVVFLEPYVANSAAVYLRLKNELEAQVTPVPGGLIEEYTDSLVRGLLAVAAELSAEKSE